MKQLSGQRRDPISLAKFRRTMIEKRIERTLASLAEDEAELTRIGEYLETEDIGIGYLFEKKEA